MHISATFFYIVTGGGSRYIRVYKLANLQYKINININIYRQNKQIKNIIEQLNYMYLIHLKVHLIDYYITLYMFKKHNLLS